MACIAVPASVSVVDWNDGNEYRHEREVSLQPPALASSFLGFSRRQVQTSDFMIAMAGAPEVGSSGPNHDLATAGSSHLDHQSLPHLDARCRPLANCFLLSAPAECVLLAFGARNCKPLLLAD